MNRAGKYGFSGILLISAGLVLNELAIWLYYQIALASLPPIEPHSIAGLAGTAFIFLVPVGVLLLVCSLYLFYSEYEIVSKKNDNDSEQWIERVHSQQ